MYKYLHEWQCEGIAKKAWEDLGLEENEGIVDFFVHKDRFVFEYIKDWWPGEVGTLISVPIENCLYQEFISWLVAGEFISTNHLDPDW
jgi:hypothetical protein